MIDQDYDVVVVGCRVAGAATAMLLARGGLSVLAVDRAGFPSDTVSSHQLQVSGAARLHRWGLLEPLRQAGVPGVRSVRYDQGRSVLDGQFPEHEGVSALYSPRRTLLDSVVLDGARAAGAHVRERFHVETLLWDEGRVVGLTGRPRGSGGRPVSVRARLVVGADGKNSTVAKAVGARVHRRRPVSTYASYGYWEGVGLTGGELYQREGSAVAAFPGSDGLAVIFAAGPAARFPQFRADPMAGYLRALDRCADLGERVRSGRPAEHLRTTPDLPHLFRTPHGPGWALVGDAGLTMDPVSAMGMSNALRDAEFLAEAVLAGLAAEPAELDRRLARYQVRRDAAARPVFAFTDELAKLSRPTAAGAVLMGRLAEHPPAERERFFGVFAGVTSFDDYFAARNLLRLLGSRGLARIAGTWLGRPPARAAERRD